MCYHSKWCHMGMYFTNGKQNKKDQLRTKDLIMVVRMNFLWCEESPFTISVPNTALLKASFTKC